VFRCLATLLLLTECFLVVLPAAGASAQTVTPQEGAQGPAAAAPAQGQPPAPPPVVTAEPPNVGQKEFRFVSTTKVATMERELNELAAQGFRLERVSKSMLGDDLALLVSREQAAAAEGGPRYEYRAIATRRAGTMDKEIKQAAAEGFELRGLTSMMRPGLGMLIGDETAAMMERRVGETKPRFEYQLLSTRREKTLQKELDAAAAAGYVPVEMTRGQDNGAASILLGPQFVITVIMARPVGGGAAAADAGADTASAATAAPAPAREYKLLETTKVGTMEREMNKAAREGYRYYMSAPDMLTLMYRERGAEGPAPYQYKLLATMKTGTMQKELLEHVSSGYRYLATSSGLGGLTTILERDAAPAAERREVRLLATSRESTTRREIAEALAEGYRILDLTTIGEFIVVLDRESAAGTAPAAAKAN
jgi:hypothetical protein